MRRIRRLTWVLLVAMLCLLLPSFSAPAMAFTDAKYYIEVDIGNQIVTIYDADTMSIVRQMLCSAGKKEHWTPVGEYILQADERRSDRDPWYKIGDIYVRYATRLYGPVLFHSIPYYAKKTDCIDRDAVKLLGIPASHGCIRLHLTDAKWVYDNCGAGTVRARLSNANGLSPGAGKGITQSGPRDTPCLNSRRLTTMQLSCTVTK